MVSHQTAQDHYFYFGIGVVALVVLVGLVLISTNFLNTVPATSMVSLAVQTPPITYHASIAEEKMFSSQPFTVLFSAVDSPIPKEPIVCTMNCVKQK